MQRLVLIILALVLVLSIGSCKSKYSGYDDDDYFWSRQETWDSFAEWNAKQ